MRQARTTLPAVLMLGVLVFLAGCAGKPMGWYRDSATQQEFSRDSYECERESWRLPKTGYGLAGDMDHSDMMRRMYVQCMRARGYTSRP